MKEKELSNISPDLIHFKKIGASDIGYISVAEIEKNIPFEIRRVYWTYYTPNHIKRGGHAHKNLSQVIIAVSGEIVFELEALTGKRLKFVLNEPNMGLFIPPGYWRDITFSHNSVLLCLASNEYLENDYIRDYEEFKNSSFG